MNKKESIQKVRAFHRFYMPAMNLLGNHYLGSEHSVTEARTFFEIYEHEGCNAVQITKSLNIDKSYLSRILKSFEKHDYVQKVPSHTDGRSHAIYLTEKGKRKAEELFSKADEEIETILEDVSEAELSKLTNAYEIIMSILQKKKEGNACDHNTICTKV